MVEKPTGFQHFKYKEKIMTTEITPENNEKILKLDDSTIAQIAKLVQLAILTGTDIVDNLRTLRLTQKEESLYLSEDYRENFEKNLETLMDEADPENDKEIAFSIVKENTRIF